MNNRFYDIILYIGSIYKVYAWLTNKYPQNKKQQKLCLFSGKIKHYLVLVLISTPLLLFKFQIYHLIRIKGVFFYIYSNQDILFHYLFQRKNLLNFMISISVLLFFFFFWVKKQPIKIHFSMILALLTVVTKQHRVFA